MTDECHVRCCRWQWWLCHDHTGWVVHWNRSDHFMKFELSMGFSGVWHTTKYSFDHPLVVMLVCCAINDGCQTVRRFQLVVNWEEFNSFFWLIFTIQWNELIMRESCGEAFYDSLVFESMRDETRRDESLEAISGFLIPSKWNPHGKLMIALWLDVLFRWKPRNAVLHEFFKDKLFAPRSNELNSIVDTLHNATQVNNTFAAHCHSSKWSHYEINSRENKRSSHCSSFIGSIGAVRRSK